MLETEIDQTAAVVCSESIHIAASPAAVWAVFSDVSRWPEWNPDIITARVDRPIAAGSTIHWQAGGMDIQSRLVLVEPSHQLVWNGTHKAVHVWTFAAEGDGTFLTNAESIAEFPASYPPEDMRMRLSSFLELWNKRLKARAEA